MNNNEALIRIADYLNAFEKDLLDEYNKASDDFRPITSAKMSVVSEIIEYVERVTGIEVRLEDYER